ncbi:O-antigen ligase domain-containing protein [Sphingorhabdus sp. IMCC26285]|uniref:O-antigen ligase domain-containing protein n=1 Tax=Sphingorhabdus profundilacus TaxID=2509718 RepID=A0A6I4LYC4_9SPHN|nr:O-antigen ligase family protein [Sphingorhabdus profundilacus]MVZ98452.1 O-antigen ligase domain-containing protein [Sphingorhabdus profundilacus]
MSRFSQWFSKLSIQFLALSLFIFLTFSMGGSSRMDVQSLALLRPISVLFCGFALLTIRQDHFQKSRGILIGFGLIFLLLLIFALPIPQDLAQAMPGQQLIVEIRKSAGVSNAWTSINLVPVNGTNAIASMTIPLAVILFGIQLEKEDMLRLLPLLIGLGAASGLFGFFQVISSSDSPFFLYRLTNEGSAVGLFANRNHAAVLLAMLIPMLAVYASFDVGRPDQSKTRVIRAAALLAVLVPLILITGSRSGFLIAVMGLAGAVLLYKKPRSKKNHRHRSSFISKRFIGMSFGIGVIGLVFVTIFFSRATAIERLFAKSANSDLRQDFWISSLSLVDKYLPLGSGPGSFAEAFRIGEATNLLDATYLNRAHNDWVETAVVLGVPGILLMGAGVLWYVNRVIALSFGIDGNRRSVVVSRLAAVLLAMFAVASFVDYPLRTPTMMTVFVLTIFWFKLASTEARSHLTPNT